jgi:hypothetical protein
VGRELSGYIIGEEENVMARAGGEDGMRRSQGRISDRDPLTGDCLKCLRGVSAMVSDARYRKTRQPQYSGSCKYRDAELKAARVRESRLASEDRI